MLNRGKVPLHSFKIKTKDSTISPSFKEVILGNHIQASKRKSI